jgi:hypothetical protein
MVAYRARLIGPIRNSVGKLSSDGGIARLVVAVRTVAIKVGVAERAGVARGCQDGRVTKKVPSGTRAHRGL